MSRQSRIPGPQQDAPRPVPGREDARNQRRQSDREQDAAAYRDKRPPPDTTRPPRLMQRRQAEQPRLADVQSATITSPGRIGRVRGSIPSTAEAPTPTRVERNAIGRHTSLNRVP